MGAVKGYFKYPFCYIKIEFIKKKKELKLWLKRM
ncbi:ORF407 [Staphylococcus phage Twort]|uniref:ORF407 n=1 Tax=Staphylococcus phage Twort (strain DSM 17442 / HER 48) TaxID=2908167 RepID=Q4Z989_BPTWO|nr:ORF407 [Staphylococcus phage Twort]AAX92490.1 ORF407 [Staphylococcus phage Twort]